MTLTINCCDIEAMRVQSSLDLPPREGCTNRPTVFEGEVADRGIHTTLRSFHSSRFVGGA